MESARALRRKPFHRQKLHLVLSGMRHLAAELGDRARYLRADTYREALEQVGRPVLVHEPTSHAAADLVERLRKEGLVAEILPTPTFALSRKEFTDWAGERSTFRMEDFYRAQRVRFDVLMDGPDPLGGKWNHDHANREPPPRGATTLDVPGPWQPEEDDIDAEVRADLDRMNLPTIGRDGPRWFAVTADEAQKALRHFVDASTGALRPARGRDAHGGLGDGALTALGAAQPRAAASPGRRPRRRGRAPGGRGADRERGGLRPAGAGVAGVRLAAVLALRARLPAAQRPPRARTPLPDWWRALDADAVTARCLRTALEGVRDRGWTHHIQRLMVLGNHALQRGYRPAELSDWFREAFVDGFEWVMPPNVIGMSQHADGGLLATKPYSSGGAYISRMSDHCGDCAFDPRKRLGDDACPFTAGYWAWTHRHRELLAANHRTARAVASMERLADLDAVLEQEAGREVF